MFTHFKNHGLLWILRISEILPSIYLSLACLIHSAPCPCCHKQQDFLSSHGKTTSLYKCVCDVYLHVHVCTHHVDTEWTSSSSTHRLSGHSESPCRSGSCEQRHADGGAAVCGEQRLVHSGCIPRRIMAHVEALPLFSVSAAPALQRPAGSRCEGSARPDLRRGAPTRAQSPVCLLVVTCPLPQSACVRQLSRVPGFRCVCNCQSHDPLARRL